LISCSENSKNFLLENPKIADEIELTLRQNAGLIADTLLDGEIEKPDPAQETLDTSLEDGLDKAAES